MCSGINILLKFLDDLVEHEVGVYGFLHKLGIIE